MTEQRATGFDFEALRRAELAARAAGQGGDIGVPEGCLWPRHDPSRRERGRGRGPRSIQRGLRVSGRDACARRGEPQLARRQDRTSGGGSGLGRVELPPTDGGPTVYPTLMMT